jgi:hypothetical protein
VVDETMTPVAAMLAGDEFVFLLLGFTIEIGHVFQ